VNTGPDTGPATEPAVNVVAEGDGDWAEPERYPTLLGVTCDADDPSCPDGECQEFLEADFIVAGTDTRATRLGYVLDHAATQGWTVIGRHHPESAMTYCPGHEQDGRDFAARVAAIHASRDA
jgi:hypothetical protein